MKTSRALAVAIVLIGCALPACRRAPADKGPTTGTPRAAPSKAKVARAASARPPVFPTLDGDDSTIKQLITRATLKQVKAPALWSR